MTAPAPETDANFDRPPHRLGRRWFALGATLAVVTGVASWTAIRTGATATDVASPPATATATVTRQDLADARTFTGTLGHGSAVTVTASRQGVVTRLAPAGTEIDRGTELFRVNEQPVTALYGTVPMYRDLREGDGGVDVAQLETNLAQLGYTGFTVDGTFTAETAAAVRRWQSDLGLAETGVVALQDVVFVAEGSRIQAIRAGVGTVVAPVTPMLDVTASDHIVSLDVRIRDRALLRLEEVVTVRLPDGSEMAGTVTSARAIPEGPGGGAPGDALIAVEVTLEETVDEAFLGFPAVVLVEVDRRVDVLTVPVNALLASSGGGHAVEVARADGSTTLVPVETGLFGAGRVEVTGEGIDEGTVVVVAGR